MSQPETPTPAPHGPNSHSQAMAAALGAILDRVRGARDALPLMAALENSLRSKGMQAIHETALSTMVRVAAQLEALPIASDDAAMQALRLHVMDRVGVRTTLPSSGPLSDFGDGDALEVSEVSFSDFDHAGHEISDFMSAQEGLQLIPMDSPKQAS